MANESPLSYADTCCRLPIGVLDLLRINQIPVISRLGATTVEQFYLREQDLTAEFEKFIDRKIVCDFCYQRYARSTHGQCD